MKALELKAELSVRMIDLERAIDMGLPYTDLKTIYSEIKELQLQLILADAARQEAITSTMDDFLIE